MNTSCTALTSTRVAGNRRHHWAYQASGCNIDTSSVYSKAWRSPADRTQSREQALVTGSGAGLLQSHCGGRPVTRLFGCINDSPESTSRPPKITTAVGAHQRCCSTDTECCIRIDHLHKATLSHILSFSSMTFTLLLSVRAFTFLDELALYDFHNEAHNS